MTPSDSSGTVYLDSNDNKQKTFFSKASRAKESKKLDDIIEDSEEIIYEVSAVFPFDLFPDKIIIDKHKITIVRRALFFKRLFPIPLRDLQTVRLNRSLIFAALEFEIRGYNTNPQPVSFLWPAHALKAEKYILGLVHAVKSEVDLTQIKTDKITEKMDKVNAGNQDSGMF